MAGTFLLLLVGVWLVTQSTVGELGSRLLSWRGGVGDPARNSTLSGSVIGAAAGSAAGAGVPAGAIGGSAAGASAAPADLSGLAGVKPASNAEAKAQGMVEWRGLVLAPKAMRQWVPMANEAAKVGIDLANGWGWRSTQRQKELRVINGCPDVCCAPSSSCRVPTARPGTSKHEVGLAVDLKGVGYSHPAYKWMKANAGRYGFSNTVSGEAWHWSLGGG